MWCCEVCGAKIEQDDWNVCWNCSAPRGGTPEELEAAREKIHQKDEEAKKLRCIRCEQPLRYLGTFRPRIAEPGWLGDLGLLSSRRAMDQYFCPGCGKVESFLKDVGEDRPTDE